MLFYVCRLSMLRLEVLVKLLAKEKLSSAALEKCNNGHKIKPNGSKLFTTVQRTSLAINRAQESLGKAEHRAFYEYLFLEQKFCPFTCVSYCLSLSFDLQIS